MRRTITAIVATGLLTLTGTARAASLYAELGQQPGLIRLVDVATELWQADPRVRATFEDVNIPRFKRLLVDQLCQLSGGGCAYAGRSMYDAHKGLHLDTRQFNALAEDLQIAMDRVQVPFFVQNQLVALLAPMHRDVVTR